MQRDIYSLIIFFRIMWTARVIKFCDMERTCVTFYDVTCIKNLFRSFVMDFPQNMLLVNCFNLYYLGSMDFANPWRRRRAINSISLSKQIFFRQNRITWMRWITWIHFTFRSEKGRKSQSNHRGVLKRDF